MSTYDLTVRFSIYLRSMLMDDLAARFGICPWKPGYEGFLLEGIGSGDMLVIADASRFLPVKQ